MTPAVEIAPNIEPGTENSSDKVKQLEADNGDLRRQIEQLTKEKELLRQKLIEAISDSVTGLRQRGEFYKRLQFEIPQLLNLDPQKDWVEAILALDPEDYDHVPFSIAMSDVSYLSLVNSISHEEGDVLLRTIADVSRSKGSPDITGPADEEHIDAPLTAYRHGGDEISMVLQSDRAGSVQLARDFAEEVSQVELEALKSHGYEPHVDVGVSHFSEALKAFQEYVKKAQEINPQVFRDQCKRIDCLLDIWAHIADRRADLNKAMVRTELMMRLRELSSSQLEEDYSFIAKGAYNLREAQIDNLITKKRELSPEEWRKALFEFLDDLKYSHEKTQGDIQSARVDVIRKYANEGFGGWEEKPPQNITEN